MIAWFRRHPIWSCALALFFGLLYLAAANDDEEPGIAILAVTLFVLALVGVIALIRYTVVSITMWFALRRVNKRSAFTGLLSEGLGIGEMPITLIEPTASVATPTASESPSIPPPLDLGDLLAMSPTAFEQLCARVLLGLGYEDVRRSGGSGDLSADITATDTFGRAVVVQCKRYAPGSSVGTPALQSFIGMVHIHHEAERGIFMTTAHYSQPAISFAQKHKMVLIDGAFLVDLLDLANIR